MFFFYQFFLTLALLISPIVIFLRILRKKEDVSRFVEKFSSPTCKRKRGKLLWFHGASVGEILSVIPLIQHYEKYKSIDQILVTSSTLSSSKVLKKYKLKKTIHQFYPIDHFYFTKKFINYWKPNFAIFVESEIWPCMFNDLEQRKVPLILLNARLTKKTFKRWMLIKKFSKSIFEKIKISYPQNLETKFFLKKIKTNKIKILGNLKFIKNKNNKYDKINDNLKKELSKKMLWVASSTHQGEEIFCSKVHMRLKKRFKNLITIIIPRHVHRVKNLIPEIKDFHLKVATHSSKPRNLKNIDIYIVDTFGETEKFYKLASSVFLGGSVIKRGGQNPLEAARFGAKILHGPNINNFEDIYKLLRKIKVSKKIKTVKELSSSIIFEKNMHIGKKIKNIGEIILKKTIKELDTLINNEFKKT